ncbi:hypothetical protein GCM10019016_079100 [Streptomyces prasinosporus]|uniref:Uncharacterized protein n=1 Tax=Streptomyces prasinosporus TaxID=68256 RepID=A0ABP6U295_9ACTN|nr:hypothetical protein GCM10010332_49320 [Streptomyces albogriseolus]
MPSISSVISMEVVAMPMPSASPLPAGAEDAGVEEAAAAPESVLEELSPELPHAVRRSAEVTPAAAARTTRCRITEVPFTEPCFYLLT